MIFRFVECDPSALLDVFQYFFWKIDMSIQTSPDCGPTKRNFAQSFDRFLRALLRIRGLLRVTGEFLSESNWRRVHQMRPPNLHDVPEFFGLRFECAMQFTERRHQ